MAGGLTGYFTRSATEPSGAADTSLGRQTIPFYGAHGVRPGQHYADALFT